MKQAPYLLRTTFLGVKEVVDRCGGMDVRHFVGDFMEMKCCGKTPRAFRMSEGKRKRLTRR
jgi:hypothetical protein